MRKAFDANVPKLKPRLGAARAAMLPVEVRPAPTATTTAETVARDAVHPERSASAHPERSRGEAPAESKGAEASALSRRAANRVRDHVEVEDHVHDHDHDQVQSRGGGVPGNDVLSRRDRLDKIKRRVAEAARPQARIPAAPADPARAAESVLALVRDLEGELVRAREREEALRGDLDEVRRELARASGEGRSAVERLAVTEQELEQKRAVLGELLGEMQALEEERDSSVRRAQALAALDEERAKLLEELGRRGDEEARIRAEREAEVELLSEELRLAGTEGARLRAAVGELARERDQLGTDLDRTRGERDELVEAKRALESVHAALAQARARLG